MIRTEMMATTRQGLAIGMISTALVMLAAATGAAPTGEIIAVSTPPGGRTVASQDKRGGAQPNAWARFGLLWAPAGRAPGSVVAVSGYRFAL